MKVRISYSIELENLMDKISNIIHENVLPLEQTTKLLDATSETLKLDKQDSAVHAHKILDKIRRNLASVDESLAEASTLLQGYVENFVNQPQQTVPPPEPSPEPPPEPSQEPPPKGRDPIEQLKIRSKNDVLCW